MVITWLMEAGRALAFVRGVNLLGLGITAVGLLVAAVVAVPVALGAAAWEACHRRSFTRWGPVVGLILALLALLVLPTYGAAAPDDPQSARDQGVPTAIRGVETWATHT